MLRIVETKSPAGSTDKSWLFLNSHLCQTSAKVVAGSTRMEPANVAYSLPRWRSLQLHALESCPKRPQESSAEPDVQGAPRVPYQEVSRSSARNKGRGGDRDRDRGRDADKDHDKDKDRSRDQRDKKKRSRSRNRSRSRDRDRHDRKKKKDRKRSNSRSRSKSEDYDRSKWSVTLQKWLR